MVAAIPIAMLAYGSIIAIASIAGEIDKPQKNIPKIMSFSVLLTITVYLLILASVFGLAPVSEFIADPSRQYFPLAYALLRNSQESMNFLLFIIPLGAILAISTTMLVLIMDSSRTIMALSDKGFLPKYFAKVDKRTGTPLRALGLVAIITILFTMRQDFIWLMINTGSVCCAITVVFIAAAQISLKNKKDEIYVEGAYHTPLGKLFPILTILVVAVTLLILYMGEGGKMTFVLSGSWYLLGLGIYLFWYFIDKKKSLGEEARG